MSKTGLHDYLQKSEIAYIARHGGGYPETFEWDADIEGHVSRIGFKPKGHDEIDGNRWMRTAEGIDICLTDGFVYANRQEETP